MKLPREIGSLSVVRRLRPEILASACLLVLFSSHPALAVESLRIGSTGAALGLMTRLAEAYRQATPEVAIEVLPSLGSGGSIRALGDNAIDIAVSARPLEPSEAAGPLVAAPLARTPFVMVTSRRAVTSLASDDLARLYRDPAARWPDGMPLRLLLRPDSDSDSAFLRQHFAGMAAALEQAQARPEVPVAQTDQENIELAMTMEGSLASATLTQIISEEAPVVTIPIDGVDPSLESLENGRYPYFKELIIVRRRDAAGAVSAFMAYIASEQGRRVLRENGNLPLS